MRIFAAQNTKIMALIKRQLQSKIQDLMFQGKAIVLIGARQVGKSTLFQQILDSEDLPVPREQILKLDCDDAEVRTLLEHSDNLNDMRNLVANNRVIKLMSVINSVHTFKRDRSFS